MVSYLEVSSDYRIPGVVRLCEFENLMMILCVDASDVKRGGGVIIYPNPNIACGIKTST